MNETIATLCELVDWLNTHITGLDAAQKEAFDNVERSADEQWKHIYRKEGERFNAKYIEAILIRGKVKRMLIIAEINEKTEALHAGQSRS